MISDSQPAVDRRGFLKCMLWAGAVVLWSFSGSVPSSRLLGAQEDKAKAADFTFVHRGARFVIRLPLKEGVMKSYRACQCNQ
jgi:hypothetical protein